MLRGLIFTGLALIVSVGCATPVLAKTFQSDPASAQVLASEVVAKVSVSALAPSESLRTQAASSGALSYTTKLKVGPIFSSAQKSSWSFLRFYNTGSAAGTVIISMHNDATGALVASWTSPSIAAGAEQQYAIKDIEREVGIANPPNYYSLSVQSGITGYFQHVLYRPADGTLTNLSTCMETTTSDATKIAGVHSSIVGDLGFPSSIAVNNTGAATATVTLGIYDARNGSKLGSYTTDAIPSGGLVVVTVATMETSARIARDSAPGHYVVKAESTFTGFIQHLVYNQKAGVITDMTTVCALQPDSLVNIQTYERLPTIAYPASVTSATAGLIQEIVSVKTPKSAGEYSQLYVTKLGYQPSWYPYTEQGSAPIQVGLYKADTINKQPNFVKAINPHDAGGWLMDYYNAGYFPSTFDRIKSIGGNNVVYADSAIIKTMDVNAKSVVLIGKYFPPDQVILDMGNLARSRGMDFTVMMGIYPGDALGNDSWTVPKFYSAIDKISENDPFWDAWFNAYKLILGERAALSQRAGATRFVLGFNLGFMVNKGNSRWVDLIQAVRSAGFTGKISYIAGTNGKYNDLSWFSDVNKQTAFIKLFDEIGLSLYNPIFPENGETLSAAQPRTRIIKNVKNQIASISSAKVPILLMIGTPSVHSGLISNEYIEPILPCAYFKDQTGDYQAQADIYQSVAEIVNEQSSDGSGIVRGIFSWGYHYLDNPRKKGGVQDVDTCYDFAASIRNKPAESVLSYWFKGW